VCFASLDYPTNAKGAGVGTYIRTVANQLSRIGHEVLVIALSRNKEREESFDGPIRIVYVSPHNLHWYISKFPLLRNISLAIRELEYSYAVWKAVKKIHDQKSLDIVQSTETGNFFLALFQKRMSFSFVIRLHGEKYTIYKHRPDREVGFDIWLCRLFQLWAIKNTSHLMSPSYSHAKRILNEVKIEKRISVIPNFLDYEFIDKVITTKVSNLDIIPENKTVLYVGRLEYGKGIWPLLQAAITVVKSVSNVQFLLAGTHHPTLSPSELSSFIKSNQLDNNVRILGHVCWEDLLALYKKSSIVVMPSYYETFGNTFLEAMLFEKPVIGFSGSSLEEIIEDGRSGHIIKRGDISCLACRIESLLKNREVREAMGREGRRRAVEKFSVSVVLPKLLAFYDEVLASSGFHFAKLI